ncbi:peptidase S41 [Bacteroidia bacterium]|nr:peptidase S41 [Bacteroidia bacterium]
MKLKIAFLIVCLSWSCSLSLRAQLTEDQRFKTAKNLDIYNAMVKELMLYYVDTIDIEKNIRADINYFLRQLDPYTEYIPEEEMSDFKFQTTGEYGGIGSIISIRDNKIIIVEPYEGMPAALAGLIPGDEILEINGESMQGKTTAYASEHLKGQPHSQVKIKYMPLGGKTPKEVTIERQRIYINPVTYFGVLSDTIGYIYLSSFTAQSAQVVKEALLNLINNQPVRSLIFDVRDNGGGSVEDCLEMLNFFVPRGELLLSMKGRVKQQDRTYHATETPLFPGLPLAVLVNANSASASEILSGAIQDLDRGVIIGSRTYGKGLVQATRQLPYDGRLKLTTAKYYIPSGRCIQAIDYAQRDEDGRVSYIPDSLTTVYYTKNGRPVKDGAGILPDIVMEEEKMPAIIYYMEGASIFFDFVTQWRKTHPKIASPAKFVLTGEIYNAFKDFVKAKDFTYDRQSAKAMESLKKIMEFEGYLQPASAEFQALENKLKPDLDRDLEVYKKQISEQLAIQIMKQYYYAKGMVEYSLKNDLEVQKAIEILHE